MKKIFLTILVLFFIRICLADTQDKVIKLSDTSLQIESTTVVNQVVELSELKKQVEGITRNLEEFDKN